MSLKITAIPIKKSDAKLQVVYGEVYLPYIPDSDGDFMNPDEIRKTAHNFLLSGRGHSIDIEHDENIIKAGVVESFQASEGDPIFVPGAWVVGVYIPDKEVWAMVENGDLSGFSMQGLAVKTETTIELEVPEFVKGETDSVLDHTHGFSVSFTEDGVYLGGITLPAEDGHFHQIIKGTSTEKVNDHSHRFAFIEEWANV